MKNYKGLEITKCPMMAEVEIIYKSKTKRDERPVCTRSSDIYKYLLSIWNHNKIDYVEEMVIVCFNSRNQAIGWAKIASGSGTGVVCDPKLIFQVALLHNASNIAIAHNHPSGDRYPSEADKSITKKIHQAGKILDIRLLDHLVITEETYYSFADEGHLDY